MDWKSELVSSIEAAVQAGVEAALQRSGYASVEDSMEETARRRTSWFGEAGRRRIERQEDRVRRDPVYAEKIARLHAAFRLPWTTASASTPSTVSVPVVPKHCYFDPEPASAASTATLTSPVAASVDTACASRDDNNLADRPPTACSMQCASRDITVSVSALAPAAPSAMSAKVSAGGVPECYSLNLQPMDVASTPTSVDISSACSTKANPLKDEVVSLTASAMASERVSPSMLVPKVVLLDSTPDIVLGAAAEHETNTCSVTSFTCTKISSPPAVFMRPAVGDLLEGGDELNPTSPSICLIMYPDGPTTQVNNNNTNSSGGLPLHIPHSATALLVEYESGCSDIAIVHEPQALDIIPLTTSPDPSDDTKRDDRCLLSSVGMAQSPGMHDMFRTLPRTLWPPITLEVCTSLAARRKHLVIRDKRQPCSAVTKNLGGTFHVTSSVLILKGIYSRSIHHFESATSLTSSRDKRSRSGRGKHSLRFSQPSCVTTSSQNGESGGLRFRSKYMSSEEIKSILRMQHFDFTAVAHAHHIIDNCLKQLQFQQANKCPIYLQFGQLQVALGELLELKSGRFCLFDLEYYDDKSMSMEPLRAPVLPVHLNWQIALSSDFLELVNASSLQAVVLYWSANYLLHYGCERLHWLIAWSLEVGNSYAVVMVSYFYMSSRVWVILSSAGYVICATSYGAEYFEWQIAWPMVLEHCDVDNKQLIPAAPLRPFALAKDTPGIKVEAPTFCCGHSLDHPYCFDQVHADQDFWTHLILVMITQWLYKGLNLWSYPMPSVCQVRPKGIVLVPRVERTASGKCYGIVMLEMVIGEETPILQYSGGLHEKEVCWSVHHHNKHSRLKNLQILESGGLPWLYSRNKEFFSDSFPCYIAWLHVRSSFTGSDFNGNATPSVYHSYQHKDAWLRLLFWKLPCTCKLSSVWLLRDPSYSIQWCSQILQWQIAWSLYPSPLQTWVSCCSPGKVALYNYEQLQRHIQQPEIWSVYTEYKKVVPIAWHFRGYLILFTGYDAAKDHGKASSSIQWDPGGVVWWRLEGKPAFKEGGMLATIPSTAMCWTVGCSYWAWASLNRRAAATTYTKGRTTNKAAWIGTALASSLLSPSSSSLPCSSSFLFL